MAALLGGSLLVPASAYADTGTTYYVSEAGDDSSDGTSAGTAWRSLDRINATEFAPGDHILLRAGDSWIGQLWPKGSGTESMPIVIASFGTGDKPEIRGDGTVADAVRLFNQEHWAITDLDVSNQRTDGADDAADLGDYRGIHISGDNSETLDGFLIDSVDVHDVTGEVNWISGSVANNAPGIHFKTGWDGSKRTGGIVFDATVPDIENPPDAPTILNGITVQDSTVINTSFAGIVVKQYTGDGTDGEGETIATATGWGTRTSRDDTTFSPHTDVTVRGNYIQQDGTAYGCNGMYITDVRGGLIEGNTVYRAGTSGIELYYADDVVVQQNEVYETQAKAGGADSNGIDPDKGTTGILIQGNYLHGNGDGVLICQFGFGDTVVRNNVIADNKRYPIYLHSDRAASAKIYHNTIYNSVSNYLIYGYGSSLLAAYDIRNNIIYSTKAGATLTTSSTIVYANNLYGGAALTIPGDAAAIVGDPVFAGPVPSGPYGTAATGPQLDTALAFGVLGGSPAVGRAATVSPASEVDYAGHPVPASSADVGAIEYATGAGAVSEAVSGFVRDGRGAALAGVAVTIAIGSASVDATTDASGWYRVTGIPFGEGTVTAAKTGYAGEPLDITVGPGSSTNADIVLASASGTGTVSGRVLDVTGEALADAAVAVLSGGTVVATATSGADGAFSVETPIGDGYTVAASKSGLRSASDADVSVSPAATTTTDALLLQPAEPDALFDDDFQGRAVGAFASADGYTVSSAGGSVAVVSEPVANSLKITRTANSGSTSVRRDYASPLTGLVTVEARVMRDNASTTATNWFSVPYLYGADGKVAVSVGFSRGQIVVYQGTSSTNVAAYTAGRWYTVTLQVDTVNQRFSLLLDGEAVVRGAAFRNVLAGGIARVEWYANSSNLGSVDLDDIRILQGTERDKGNTALASVSTDLGAPVPSDGVWTLSVPARSDAVRVTALPEATVIASMTIDGVAAEPGEASAPIELDEGGNDIPIVVTAENGTTAHHVLHIDRGFLAADATLGELTIADAEPAPLFDPDVVDYAVTLPAGASSMTVTAVPTGPRSDVTIGGEPVEPGVPTRVVVSDGDVVDVVVSSADGTAVITYSVTVTVPAALDASPPASAVLSTTAGWSGLQDGSFEVRADLWWGVNGRAFRLFQDGEMIAEVPLTADGVHAQHATVPISGLPNGTYVFTGEFANTAGRTATTSVTVTVTQAAPAAPALRVEGSGSSYRAIADLWWGTNATSYTLYDGDMVVAVGTLAASTPAAQHVERSLALESGRHDLRVEFANAAGGTSSPTVSVTVP